MAAEHNKGGDGGVGGLAQDLIELKVPESVETPCDLDELDRHKVLELRKDWHDGVIARDCADLWAGEPRCFLFPESVYEAACTERAHELGDLNSCSMDECPEVLSLLLYAEEFHHAVEMRKLDQVGAKLTIEKDAQDELIWYGFEVRNLSSCTFEVWPQDLVILMNADKSFAAMLKIANICDDCIQLPVKHFEQLGESNLRQPLNISIFNSGLPFGVCQITTDLLPQLNSVLFEDQGEPNGELAIDVQATSTLKLEARLARLDEGQQRAVLGILEAKCRPKPYILTGPPGTGKTETLVEAIAQVYWRSINAKRIATGKGLLDCGSLKDRSGIHMLPEGATILVCANSNACANILYAKLREVAPAHAVIRARTKYSFRPGSRQIIVSTLNKVGRSAVKGFRCDYVFLDEANRSNLAQSLGSLGALGGDKCLLVLAGDPNQLGPIVQCRQASKLGLDQSLLDWLLKFEIYQRDPASGGAYNNDCITKLQECYRSDQRIMAPSNRLFYEGHLRCPEKTPPSLMQLLNLTKPIQFVETRGAEQRLGKSGSWINTAEAEACAKLVGRLYLMGFEPEQIGITSPYKSQVDEIKQKLEQLAADKLGSLKSRFPREQGSAGKSDLGRGSASKAASSLAGRKLDKSRSQTTPLGSRDVEQDRGQCGEEPAILEKRLAQEQEEEAARSWLCTVGTVGSFQMEERDIMIISTVRTERGDDFERLEDARRFNTAASRAKWLLVVVGNSDVLDPIDCWSELLREAGYDL